MSTSTINAAKRMGGAQVQPALELVGCEENVQRAMQYVFGSALICKVRESSRSLSAAGVPGSGSEGAGSGGVQMEV